MKNLWGLSIAVVGALLGLVAPATADDLPLPPAGYPSVSVRGDINGKTYFTDTSKELSRSQFSQEPGGSFDVYAGGSTVGLLPTGLHQSMVHTYVKAEGIDPSYLDHGAAAIAHYQYAFMVGSRNPNNPSANTGDPVAVVLTWHMTMSHGGSSDNAHQYYYFQSPFGNLTYNGPAFNNDTGGMLDVAVLGYRTYYTITMHSETVAYVGYEKTETAEFFLDPVITIDPSWLALHPNDVVYLAAVTDPVPLPPTLLLLGPGLAGLVIIRRRFKG